MPARLRRILADRLDELAQVLLLYRNRLQKEKVMLEIVVSQDGTSVAVEVDGALSWFPCASARGQELLAELDQRKAAA
mgnify:CR=1 FL=1